MSKRKAIEIIAARLPFVFPDAWNVLCTFMKDPDRRKPQAPVTRPRLAEMVSEQEIRETKLCQLLACDWLAAAAGEAFDCLFFLNANSQLVAFPKDLRGTDQLMAEIQSPTTRDSPYFYDRLARRFPEAMKHLTYAAATAWKHDAPAIVLKDALPATAWDELIELHARSKTRNSARVELRIGSMMLHPGTLVVSRITQAADLQLAASVTQQLIHLS